MAFSINNNFLSNMANLQLRQTSGIAADGLERIATGLKINKAADDASGLTIADQLSSQARSFGQAINNANSAIAMAQIADGALGESTQIVQDIRVKAVQAANGSQSFESRQAIQTDINNLMTSLDSIAQNTSYNGQALLSGGFSDKSFQVGANPGETASLSIESAESTNIGQTENGSLFDIDVTTAQGAQDAIAIADQALSDLANTRSDVGSVQIQLESTIRNLAVSQINTMSAQSTIQDADFAEEAMNFSKMQILEKAGVFAASKSNINKASIMNVLSGA